MSYVLAPVLQEILRAKRCSRRISIMAGKWCSGCLGRMGELLGIFERLSLYGLLGTLWQTICSTRSRYTFAVQLPQMLRKLRGSSVYITRFESMDYTFCLSARISPWCILSNPIPHQLCGRSRLMNWGRQKLCFAAIHPSVSAVPDAAPQQSPCQIGRVPRLRYRWGLSDNHY